MCTVQLRRGRLDLDMSWRPACLLALYTFPS